MSKESKLAQVEEDEFSEPKPKGSFMDRVKRSSSGGRMITIFGDPGAGKTSVAQFCLPKPFFVPIEDGLLSVPEAQSLGVPRTVEEVFAQMMEIGKAHRAKDFPFRTVVLDSITQFEVFASDFVCRQAGVENIEDVGKYALGRKLIAAQMTRLRAGCQYLCDIGLNVAAIAHSTTINEKPADMDDYSIWTLAVEEKSRPAWIADADAVIHVRIPTVTTEKGKRHVAVASGDARTRTLGVVSGPSTIAKNRFRCMDDLEFTMNSDGTFTNPLAKAFADLK